MDDLLSDQQLLTAVVSLIAAVWGSAKAWAYQRRLSADRILQSREIAFEALEVGVQEAWERKGRELKRLARKSGGKLPEEARPQLRSIALDHARSYAADRGVDPGKVLGQAVPLYIKKIIDRRKKGA